MDVYLVGGAVRDALLGLPVNDRDWVVVGSTPEAMMKLGYQPVGKDFPVFLHPETNEEYALARTERKTGQGYTGFTCYAAPDVTLEDDLKRRDLTINAIAQTTKGTLIDPYHGQQDLAARCLRHISPAFVEDPLRVLRVARFAASFAQQGFTIADETKALMLEMVRQGELDTLTAERVWQEVERALNTTAPEIFFTALQDCGALGVLFDGLTLNLEAALSALARAVAFTEDPCIRFAALLHAHPEVNTLFIAQRAPKAYTQLAALVAKQLAAYQQMTATADSLLMLLMQADSLRRPARFEQFLKACIAITENEFPAQLLRVAQAAIADVDTQALVAQGYTGEAMAAALKAKRLEAIALVL